MHEFKNKLLTDKLKCNRDFCTPLFRWNKEPIVFWKKISWRFRCTNAYRPDSLRATSIRTNPSIPAVNLVVHRCNVRFLSVLTTSILRRLSKMKMAPTDWTSTGFKTTIDLFHIKSKFNKFSTSLMLKSVPILSADIFDKKDVYNTKLVAAPGHKLII